MYTYINFGAPDLLSVLGEGSSLSKYARLSNHNSSSSILVRMCQLLLITQLAWQWMEEGILVELKVFRLQLF